MSLSPASILYDSGGTEKGTPGNPVKIDPTGTTAQPITDNGGSLTVDGTIAISGTANTNIAQVGGVTVVTGGAGGSVGIGGLAGAGAASVGNPVLVAGAEAGGTVRRLLTDSAGRLITVPYEAPSFTVSSGVVAIGSNKSMLSLLNAAASTVVVKIREIWVVNDATASVAGVVGTFQFNRITGATGGTALTPQQHDTSDALSGSVSAATGAAVTGESATPLRQFQYSTDEWGTGATDVESNDHVIQEINSVYASRYGERPITLRAAQGLSVKFTTNSTAGSFKIVITFTVE